MRPFGFYTFWGNSCCPSQVIPVHSSMSVFVISLSNPCYFLVSPRRNKPPTEKITALFPSLPGIQGNNVLPECKVNLFVIYLFPLKCLGMNHCGEKKKKEKKKAGWWQRQAATDSISITTNTLKHNNPYVSSPSHPFRAWNGLVVSRKSQLSAKLPPLSAAMCLWPQGRQLKKTGGNRRKQASEICNGFVKDLVQRCRGIIHVSDETDPLGRRWILKGLYRSPPLDRRFVYDLQKRKGKKKRRRRNSRRPFLLHLKAIPAIQLQIQVEEPPVCQDRAAPFLLVYLSLGPDSFKCGKRTRQ